VNGSPLGAPLGLEVGLRIKGKILASFVPGEGFERSEEFQFLAGPLEVFLVVGLEEELPAGNEDLAEGLEEVLLDESAAMVPGLGPGIRKEQVESADRCVWKEPLNGITCFEAQHPEVLEVGLGSPPADLADTPEKALDCEKVPLGELAGHRKGKGPITAPEIDLKRGLSCEQLIGGEPTEIIPGDQLPRFSRARRHFHGGNLKPGWRPPNPETPLPWRLTRPACPPILLSTELRCAVDLEEIRKIVELMEEHGLSLFHLEQEGVNVKLKKAPDIEAVREALGGLAMAPAAPIAAAAPTPVAAEEGEESAAENGKVVESPMVGTFYRKPAPDADDFVQVGDRVSEGQTVCIIEAMKVMNEIKSEVSGTISEICVEDSVPVQYGDALFRVT
jgi:acetyl-CoA carboxylase biotin carboxyl carrier protein